MRKYLAHVELRERHSQGSVLLETRLEFSEKQDSFFELNRQRFFTSVQLNDTPDPWFIVRKRNLADVA